MIKYIKASPDEFGFYTDEEFDELKRQRDDFYAQRKATKGKVQDFTDIMDMYDWKIKFMNKDKLPGTERIYHQLIKSVSGAERFNYHSDYWGDASYYQEKAVEVMEDIAPYVGRLVSVTYDNGTTKTYKLRGLLIDKQYNSHLAFDGEGVE